MASKRSKVAKQAWAKRKARELARSLAAIKGWQTRRAASQIQPPKQNSKPKLSTDQEELEEFKRISGRLIEKVFARRVRFFPEARRRVLRNGTKLMNSDQIVWSTMATKEEFKEAAADKSNENEDGYNPFWYH